MARRKPRKPAALPRDTECIKFSTESSLHVSEEGVGATFLNHRRKELRAIEYDGCYCRVANQGRADFIIGYDRAIDVILELKGSDLKHATNQVVDTLERWRTDPIRYRQLVCLIVFGHAIPRMRSNIGVMEREFLNRYRTLLWVRESGSERFSFRQLAGRSDA
jgi:hypothetical protein